MTHPVHLAIALDRAGWHPAAWRDPSARPYDLLAPRYWRDLLRTADDAGLVLATIEDALAITDRFESADDLRRDRVRGRLDAVLIASFAAPLTRRIGLVPTVTTTHPEPFHLATGLQTLDYASRGRAGVRLVAGASAAERANFGRRGSGIDAFPASGRVEDDPQILAAFREAGEVANALGRLWDSWQDDAIIRDVATGRFLDADRVHNIDFAGEFFSITGASIVPRSPQGRPSSRCSHTRRSRTGWPPSTPMSSSSRRTTRPAPPASSPSSTARRRAAPRSRAVAGVRRPRRADRTHRRRGARCRGASRRSRRGPVTSDARIVIGTASDVVEQVRELAGTGVDGVRLRPARQPADVVAIAEQVVPLLRSADLLRGPGALREDSLDGTDAGTLRGRLGLARPESRYAREKVAL